MKPLVAIVGRPNVGKSSLFNRLIGRFRALVLDQPGITRDRVYGDVEHGGKVFSLIDTGGLVPVEGLSGGRVGGAPMTLARTGLAGLSESVARQIDNALQEADLVLFVVDGREGLIIEDQAVAERLRKTGKPILLVVNKIDLPQLEDKAAEFFGLGLKPVLCVSAARPRGIDELCEAILERVNGAPLSSEVGPDKRLRMALVGRPNVGKSTLLNRLIGKERAIVDAVPGTTRDPLDTVVEWNGHEVVLVDTAGIRRKGKTERGIETLAVVKALKAADRAQVVIVVTDASEGITAQDAHIAGYVIRMGRGLVLACNKTDLVGSKQNIEAGTEALRDRFPFLEFATVVPISAKEAKGMRHLTKMSLAVAREYGRHVTDAQLKVLLERIGEEGIPAPRYAGHPLQVRGVTQRRRGPPVFRFYVNEPKAVNFSYERYLTRLIRGEYGFAGVPLKLEFVRK